MKRLVYAVLIGLCAVVALAAAKKPSKFLLGKWRLDVAHSKFDGLPPMKSQTRIYEDWGDNLIHGKFEGIDAQGKPTFSEWVARYDGRDYPRVSRGSATAGTLATKVIDDHTTEFTQKEDGKVTIYGTRKVSADGKTATIRYKGTSVDGKPVSAVLIFDRE